MAAPLVYFPPGDLRRGIADARRRGLAFEEAWKEAWTAVRWPRWTGGAGQWRAVLSETREEWRAAYERRPTAAGSGALALLAVVEDRGERPAVTLVA